jgi:hypothetical protein
MMNRSLLIILSTLVALLLHSQNTLAFPGTGNPLKYISSCELDLNNDGEADIAFLVETLRGREIIILLKKDTGYTAYRIPAIASSMYLSCHFGKSIKETEAGKKGGAAKIHTTPGTYIQLQEPEGSSIAYFWNGSGFTEVWTSD